MDISFKQSWEQTRFLGYVIALTQSTKHLKLSDMILFSWDKEDTKDTSMSQEDIERLTLKMNNIINQNNN